MKPPKKWKMIVLVWMAIYPTVTIIFALGGSQITRITPLPLRTLVLTGIIVPLMVLVLLPLLQRVLKNWLHK